MDAAAIEYRPFRDGDEVAINEGFNEAFHLDRPLAEWQWKFAPDPQGQTISLAICDGELVAHYAGIPVRLNLDGRVFTAAQIVDVFSRKSARKGFTRRGVWVRTVEHFFATFGESGRLALLFGFPSPRPLRLGVLQLGYDNMEPQPITYLRRENPSTRPTPRGLLYRAELARDWEPRLDVLWRRVRCDYPAAVVRDADYALRRFAGRPGVRYHRFLAYPRFSAVPVGFAVFRTDGETCRWVDLLWDRQHPGALELLAKMSARLGEQTGLPAEEMWLNGDPEGQSRLEGLGFRCMAEPRSLVMVARAFHPELDPHSLEDRVYVTMADSDLE